MTPLVPISHETVRLVPQRPEPEATTAIDQVAGLGKGPDIREVWRDADHHRRPATEPMNYIAVIHKDPDSDFGVSFPDFPGCITAGKARRHHWHRQVGNDGIVRVTVPLGQVRPVPRPEDAKGAETGHFSRLGLAEARPPGTRPMPAVDGLGQGPTTEPTPDEERPGPGEAAPENGPGPDLLTAIAIQTLSQAVEMLRQDVEREREEERRRVDGLYTDLADARTAAMISGADAAALHTQLTLLTDRRPWWRGWFR